PTKLLFSLEGGKRATRKCDRQRADCVGCAHGERRGAAWLWSAHLSGEISRTVVAFAPAGHYVQRSHRSAESWGKARSARLGRVPRRGVERAGGRAPPLRNLRRYISAEKSGDFVSGFAGIISLDAAPPDSHLLERMAQTLAFQIG